jgi:hypothetical protein
MGESNCDSRLSLLPLLIGDVGTLESKISESEEAATLTGSQESV